MPNRNTFPRSLLLALLLSVAGAPTAACTDDAPPAWQLECEATPPGDVRGNVCKEACGADQLCPGADQTACEAECNACAPDVAWCPEVAQ